MAMKNKAIDKCFDKHSARFSCVYCYLNINLMDTHIAVYGTSSEMLTKYI